MPRDARDVVASLTQKGFARREGKDLFLHLLVDGKKTAIFTKLSHGAREVSESLLGLMARQLKLTNRQLRDLVDCPLTMEGYLALLRDGGHLS